MLRQIKRHESLQAEATYLQKGHLTIPPTSKLLLKHPKQCMCRQGRVLRSSRFSNLPLQNPHSI